MLLAIFVQGFFVESEFRTIFNGQSYVLQNINDSRTEATDRFVRLRRGSKVLADLRPEHNYVKGRFVKWPFAGKLIAVRGYAASSNHTHYYVLNKTGLHGPVAALTSGMNGGPAFQDMDGDKRPEMVFDNYSYYLDHPVGTLPDKYIIYKIGKSGLPKFWKEIPNRKHRHLRDTTGMSP